MQLWQWIYNDTGTVVAGHIRGTATIRVKNSHMVLFTNYNRVAVFFNALAGLCPRVTGEKIPRLYGGPQCRII